MIKKLAAVLLLLSVGLLLALPFTRPHETATEAAPVLSTAQSAPGAPVPLQAIPQQQESPAVGLYEQETPTRGKSPPRWPRLRGLVAISPDVPAATLPPSFSPRLPGAPVEQPVEPRPNPATPPESTAVLPPQAEQPRQPARRVRVDLLESEQPPDQPRDFPRRTHVTVDGDTLPKLAARYLGDEGRGHEIFAANHDVLEHPEVLPLGVRLVIPPRESTTSSRYRTTQPPDRS